MLVEQVFSPSNKNLLWLYLCYIKVVAVQMVKGPVLNFFKVCLYKSGSDRSAFFKNTFTY